MLRPLRNFLYLISSVLLMLFTNEGLLAQVQCNGVINPTPFGGPQSGPPGTLCLNKALQIPAQIKIDASDINDSNNPFNFAVEIDWDDGSPVQIVAYGNATIPVTWGGANSHFYNIPSIPHVFLPRPCTAPQPRQCSYSPRVHLVVGGIRCPAQFGISPDFFRWNTDDQCSGDMLLSETVTGDNPFEVCAGAGTVVTFTDRTRINCLPPQEATWLNSSQRWRRFVYGTTNTISGPLPVLIAGVAETFPFNTGGAPDVSVPGPLTTSATPFANNETLQITIPNTAQVGDEFHIRMEYWNFCNRFVDGDAPVVEYGIIRVVAQPTAPLPNNNEVCNGTNPLPNFSVSFPATSSEVLWYQNNAGVPGAQVTNPFGTNNKNFPPSAYPPGGITNTTAGVYTMWASYRSVVSAGGLRCESPRVPVTLTIKDAIPTPGPISGTAAICNGATNVAFSVPIPAGVLTPGGPTEYQWDVVNAANAVVGDVTVTPNSGQGAIAQNVTANFTIANATFGAASSIVRKIRVRRRFVNAPNCNSPRVEFTVTVSRNTDIGTMSGGGTFCQGANLGNVTWNSPGWGAITRWEQATALGGPYTTVGTFGTTNPVSPNSLAFTPGTHYIRAQVQNGSCPELPTTPVLFTIVANPDVAAAGPDDAICIPSPGSLTYPLVGNNALFPVVGDWDLVSGPPSGIAGFVDQTQGATDVTVSIPGIYVFSWTLDNGTCQSVDDVQISFGRDPALPVPTDAGYCGLTGALNAAVPTGGEIIAWSVSPLNTGPGPINITNANAIPATATVTLPGVYTFRLTFSSGSCTPQFADNTVTFFEPATSSPEPDKTVCVDGNNMPASLLPIPITGTVSDGAFQGHWEIATGSGTFTSSGTATGSNSPAGIINDSYIPSIADYNDVAGFVTLRLVATPPNASATPSGPSPCGNVSNTFVVTFDKKPQDATVGLPFDVCGTTGNLSAVLPTESGSGLWTAITVGPAITDPTDNLSAVTNLQFGPNVFRWTVSSAGGTCTPTFDDFTITRTTAPLANNLNPNTLCESSPNSGIFLGFNLTSLNAAINGGAGTTVTWFRNSARTIAVATPTLEDVSNNEVFYVRVSTTGIPVCSSDAVVNFTINARPFVGNPNPMLCEEVLGVGIVNNQNLTTYNPQVDLGIGNRAVTWYSDNGLTTLVPTPADVDNITDNTIFYAEVRNTVTGCTSTALLTFTVNSIPPPNPIIGPNTVCLDPNAVIFFTVTNFHPTYNYTWTVPTNGDVTVANGSTTDFFLLLKFNVLPADDTVRIQVTETSPEGCPGVPQTLKIKVESKPGALIITGPDEVCENEKDVIYTVPVFPNITYAWTVPLGSSIIQGQGSGEIHVNFSNTTGDVVVTPSTINGCIGPKADTTVTINRRPIIENSLGKAVCSQSASEITLSVETNPLSEPAATYSLKFRGLDPGLFTTNTWVPAPPTPLVPPAVGQQDTVIYNDTFENKTATPLNVRYTVSGVSAKGCEGPDQVITLVVNPEPQLDPLLGRTVCSDEATGITLISAINTFPADGFIITGISIPVGVIPSLGSSPIPAISTTTIYPSDIIKLNSWRNETGAVQTVSYQVLPYSSLIQCAGSPPTPVNVVVYPRTEVDPITDITICNGDLLNVPFTSLTNSDAIFHWSVRSYGPDVIVGSPAIGTGNIVGYAMENKSLLLDEDVIFEVYGENPISEGPGCINPILQFTVHILKSPEAKVLPLEACADSPSVTYATVNLLALQSQINTSGDPDIQYTWYVGDPTLPGPPPATILVADLPAYPVYDMAPVWVKVQDTNPTSGCAKVVPVTYKVHPAVSADNRVSNFNGYNLQCYEDRSGSFGVEVQTGAASGYSYSLDGGPPINAGLLTYGFSGLDAGLHTILIRDGNGCTLTKDTTLVQPDSLFVLLSKIKDVTCALGLDGQVNAVGNGGTGTYPTYLMLQTNTTNATGVFPGLGAGSYTVRLTDSNGCKADSNTEPVIQPLPVVIDNIDVLTDAGGFNLSCRDASDGAITVTVSGGTVNYNVSLIKSTNPTPIPLNNTPSPANFTGLTFGNYTVLVTDSRGCPALPGAATIVNPPPFSPGFIGVNQSICKGIDADGIQQLVPAFGGVGNFQYIWQYSITGGPSDIEWLPVPGGTNATYDPPALDTTTFYRRLVMSVSTRTNTACDTLGQGNIVRVQVNQLPRVNFTGPSQACQGTPITLTVQLQPGFGTAPIEFDYSIANTGGSTTVFLNQTGGETTPLAIDNVQSSATYSLTRVRDLNGCIAPNLPPPLVIPLVKMDANFDILAPTAQCSGNTFNFQWKVEDDVKYIWDWADGSKDTINVGERPSTLQPMPHLYNTGSTEASTFFPVTLTAINAICPNISITKPIEVYPNVVLNILPGDPILCSGETIRFIDQSRGVDFGKWYYHEIGSADQLDVRNGPFPEITYTMNNITATNPLIYEVVYEASNQEGCKAEYKLPVTVYRKILAVIGYNPNPAPPFTGGISTVNFVNNSNPLDASAFEYTWDFGDVRAQPATGSGIDPITVDYFSAGRKDVTLKAVNIAARDANKNCASATTVPVLINLPMLGAAFRATPLASCFPVNITVENLSPGADTFLWELYNESGLVSTSNLRNPVFRILTPGVYDIYLTASFYATGQTAMANQKGIEVFDVPTALFEMRPNPLYVPDTELQTFNQSQRATQYDWDFDDGTTSQDFQPRHLFQLEGKYTIQLIAGYDHGNKDIDGDGILDGNVICYDTVRHELVAQNGGFIKLPNAFTPSATGPSGGVAGSGTFNDVFLPIARGVEEFSMQIFDRWGNLIFESRDRNMGWDGYDRNHRLMPAGVYVYKLILRLSNGQRTTKIGDVTLIR